MEQTQKPETGMNPSGQTTENHYMGTLPCTAPLATPYVPFQKNHPEKYEAKKGLSRGTLFPGLDLPYLGMVNSDQGEVTPLKELMAMNFAITELGLYLDTHSDDTEALALFRSYVEMYQNAVTAYEALYGPLTLTSAGQNGTFDWLLDPWPWDLCQKSAAKTSGTQTTQTKEG